MRRLLIFTSVLLIACQAVASAVFPAAPTVLPPATATQVVATRTPFPAGPAVQPVPTVEPQQAFGLSVRFHPDGPLYSGDLVSIEASAPAGTSLDGQVLSVQSNEPAPVILGEASFYTSDLSTGPRASLAWGWDTTGLPPGEYDLYFTVEPAGFRWSETVVLLPAEDRPAEERDARWVTVQSRCCVVHYITGTAAERDLPRLLLQMDEQAVLASARLGVELAEPVTLTLLPKVIGHGGFASDEISLSYLDQNYTSSTFSMVLHHELVHMLDKQKGGDLRPTLLVEGLAVYLSGGHFKSEDLWGRAHALLDTPQGLDWYVPLQSLADGFYPSQHEIGYLEGAVVVAYIVETWGWESFDKFYRDIHPQASGSQADAIDAALQEHFGVTFAQLERDLLARLRAHPVDPAAREDLRLSVLYYDTLRRYQQIFHPSAYFRSAWLPDTKVMRERGIVADFLRSRADPTASAVEILLVQAGQLLSRGQYHQVQTILESLKAVLDAVDSRENTLIREG